MWGLEGGRSSSVIRLRGAVQCSAAGAVCWPPSSPWWCQMAVRLQSGYGSSSPTRPPSPASGPVHEQLSSEECQLLLQFSQVTGVGGGRSSTQVLVCLAVSSLTLLSSTSQLFFPIHGSANLRWFQAQCQMQKLLLPIDFFMSSHNFVRFKTCNNHHSGFIFQTDMTHINFSVFRICTWLQIFFSCLASFFFKKKYDSIKCNSSDLLSLCHFILPCCSERDLEYALLPNSPQNYWAVELGVLSTIKEQRNTNKLIWTLVQLLGL